MPVQCVVAASLLLCVAVACAPLTHGNPPRPIAPQEGPSGYVRATYSGGMLYRSVEASFRVHQSAYVLIGHLGGDGVIRVLYPTNANELGLVKPGKSFRTRAFDGRYDAAPSFALARTPMSRTMDAAMDSYDGMGNGYVFMIVSKRPLAYEEVSVHGLWEGVEVPNYYTTFDPRISVRDFADVVSGGWPYTLTFASSFTSFNMDTFASAFECALFASPSFFGGSFDYFGYFGYHTTWNRLGSSPWSFGRISPCGNNRYAYVGSQRPLFYTPVTNTATTPTPPPTGPKLGRPKFIPGIGPRRTHAADRSPFGDADRGIAPRSHHFGENTWSRGGMSTGTIAISRPTEGPRLDQPRHAVPTTVAPQPTLPRKQ